MNSIRSALRRILRGEEAAPEQAEAPKPDFSYRIYWMKTAREWPRERLDEVERALRRTVERDDFEANAYERRYRIDGLDDEAHAGASLMALLQVIEALQNRSDELEKEMNNGERT